VDLYNLDIIFPEKPTHATGDVPVSILGLKRFFPQKAHFSAKGHAGRHEESRTASDLPCRSEVAERGDTRADL
jgi:hypothetical protein